MSYDFALERACRHEIIDDRVMPDKYDLYRIPRVPSNSDIIVKVDGVLVPKKGVFSPYVIRTLHTEPYHIVRNFNDRVKLSVQGFSITLDLIPGNEISSKQLSSHLDDQITAAVIVEKNSASPNLNRINALNGLTVDVDSGRIIFSYIPMGSTDTRFVMRLYDPTSTDPNKANTETHRLLRTYNLLGVNPGRVATTRQIMPGYMILAGRDSANSDPSILFDPPLRNADPIVELSYSTLAPYCGRCFGSGIEWDYSVHGSSYETVEGIDLLAQEFDKFMFTRRGSHFRWTWLGSSLEDNIGAKANPYGTDSTGSITLDMTSAFNIYQNIKVQQSRMITGQDVTDAEFPRSIDNFKVTQSVDDPTAYIANMTISSRSSNSTSLTRSIGTPSPFTRTKNIQNSVIGSSSGYILR